MDSKNFAIGVLSVTSAILLVGLVLVYTDPPRAFAAAGPGIETGDYVIGTGQFKTDEHLLYVVDSVAERMIVYRFDSHNRDAFMPTFSVDLNTLRRDVAQQKGPGQRGRKPGRP